MNPSVLIKSETPQTDWIEKNIEKAIGQIMGDVKHGRILPTSMTFNGVALKKFIAILKSQGAYWPEPDGKFKFIGIPIHSNNRLPYGTFTVERFKA